MSAPLPPRRNLRRVARNLTLASVASQVGFVTIGIILVALLVGLWLDRELETRPWATIVCLLCSVPLSVASIVWLALSIVSQIQPPERPTHRQREGEQ
ncbi:MAG TPA: AtpZ/AtpI family protein [Chloroflexi bacterium]|nr:AtpZ/AtpI family protein [Chloroflexota bacterium]